MFKSASLQTKIITISSLAVVGVIAVSTLLAMLLTRGLVEEEIYRKALSQARITAHRLLTESDLQNPAGLVPALQQVLRDVPSVKQADLFVHDAQHRLIATTAAAAEHLELDHLSNIEAYPEFEPPEADQITIETPDGKYWIMSTPIVDGGRTIGCLNLKVSKSGSSVLTTSLVRRNLLLMLASLVAVMLLIHLFFRRNVHSPVRDMIRVMEATEGGQLDVRARVNSEDEIGQLGRHLNLMLDRVSNFNSELERRVQQATAEVASRNDELKRINEELFETQKILARSERLAVAGQLAASIAHEIGTPLNSISGHVQLMTRRAAGDQASVRRLQVIERQIESIVRTVRQLLSWSRKFELVMAPVDMRQVLEETVALVAPALESKKIGLMASYAPGCPHIYGDAGYLQQVFLNLINNSMDAMSRGGTLSLRLNYPAAGDTQAIAIEVQDSGEGIAPEVLNHIFDPTFTTKRMGTGTGLGLAICQQIVQQHGGKIDARSEPGLGTLFTLTFPVDAREALQAIPQAVSNRSLSSVG